MKTWKLLETLFVESKKYRGDNSVRFVDLEKLLDFIKDNGKLADPSESIKKEGGSFMCRHTFDPNIWGKWFDSQDLALSMAAMDKDTVSQYAGRAQGYTTHKKNWGGGIVNTPGKPRTDYERMASAMDRYDILMQGDVTEYPKVNKKTGKTTTEKVGTLFRVAYSPSIGSTEERKARLIALLTGAQVPALQRRPQPHIPDISRQAADDAIGNSAPKVPRVGQNLKQRDDDDDDMPVRSGTGSGAPSHFSSFLSKHNAEYEPRVNRRKNQGDDEEDAAMAALFPRKK